MEWASEGRKMLSVDESCEVQTKLTGLTSSCCLVALALELHFSVKLSGSLINSTMDHAVCNLRSSWE